MPILRYPYEVAPLPYAYDALEPYIDAETLHFHHDKHYQTYVDKLNAALEPHKDLQDLSLEEILENKSALPSKDAQAILRNGGGVYNHAYYFGGLAPASEGFNTPNDRFSKMVNNSFDSFDAFKAEVNASAMSVFGSGWTMVYQTEKGELKIANTANQDTILPELPIIIIDAWEHAYYLKYKNERAKYLEAIWNVIKLPT